MAIAGITELVATLQQSALLEPTQVDEVTQLLSKCLPEPRKLAGELIRRDWLTPYQVNQLFAGKSKELALGPYVMLERLGEGGMGQVFKARHRTLHRVVALKILHPRLVDNEVAVRRFLREVRAAGQLTHSNIVQAFDAQQIDGRYYFAMEYIHGADLARLVKQQGPLKVPQACEFVRQTALGLQHAFECGMVHRDIKPANLLVTKAEPPGGGMLSGERQKWGQVKILDMGLARLTRQDDDRASTELTQLGTVMGTPDFIAPEQARDSHCSDVRSDLYSLGCTMYFLLTGLPPFPVGTVTERLLHHQLDEPEAVEEVRRRELILRGANPQELKYLSSRVGNVVRKLMAKRPEDRLQTPHELAETLAGLLSHNSSIALRRPLLPSQTPPPLKTPPVLLAARGPAPRPSTPLPKLTPPPPTLKPRSAPSLPPAAPILTVPQKPRRKSGLRRKLLRAVVFAGIVILCLVLGKTLWQHQTTAADPGPAATDQTQP